MRTEHEEFYKKKDYHVKFMGSARTEGSGRMNECPKERERCCREHDSEGKT